LVRHLNKAFGSFRIASTAYQIIAHIECSFSEISPARDCIANAHKLPLAKAARATDVPAHSLLACRDQ